jgi:hypothetical protein
MHIHDRRMVDEPCMRKGFLENRRIQWLATHVFWWMVTFYMDFNNVYVLQVQEEDQLNEEDQRSWKIKDEDKG